jgi:hypothetical protein
VRTRLPLAAASFAVALLPAAGHAAAPKPQIVDTVGDAAVPHAPLDIVSALYRTTGGKKLVVTLNLSGAPMTNSGMSYEVRSAVRGCPGTLSFTYTPGTATGQILGDASVWADCGEPDANGSTLVLLAGTTFELGPKSITWTVTIKTLPKIRIGAKLSDFRAAVDVVEPATGLYGTNVAGTSLDEGVGTGTWVLR